jgi:hypothetical protein
MSSQLPIDKEGLTQRLDMLFLMLESHYSNKITWDWPKDELQAMEDYLLTIGINLIYVRKGFQMQSDKKYFTEFSNLITRSFGRMMLTMTAIASSKDSIVDKHKRTEAAREVAIGNLVIELVNNFHKQLKEVKA